MVWGRTVLNRSTILVSSFDLHKYILIVLTYAFDLWIWWSLVAEWNEIVLMTSCWAINIEVGTNKQFYCTASSNAQVCLITTTELIFISTHTSQSTYRNNNNNEQTNKIANVFILSEVSTWTACTYYGCGCIRCSVECRKDKTIFEC